jgi:hypothetical protein
MVLCAIAVCVRFYWCLQCFVRYPYVIRDESVATDDAKRVEIALRNCKPQLLEPVKFTFDGFVRRFFGVEDYRVIVYISREKSWFVARVDRNDDTHERSCGEYFFDESSLELVDYKWWPTRPRGFGWYGVEDLINSERRIR